MAKYQKGQSGNPAGRPTGTGSKQYAAQIKERLGEFLSGRMDLLIKNFDKLKPYQQWRVFSDLLNYELAKQRAVEVSGDMISLISEDQSKGILKDIAKEALFKVFGNQISPELRKKYE